jgi:hypothetical protein
MGGRPSLTVAVGVLVFAISQPAFADGFSYSDWKSMSTDWKRGFASAIALELPTVAIPGEAPGYATTMGYKECFKDGVSDGITVALIDNFIMRNPAKFATPMIAVARQALNEACAAHLPE